MAESLHGKTLGIWGYGRIGKLIAGYGRAFGMKAQVHGRPAPLQAAAGDGLVAVEDERAIFANADVLPLRRRPTEATRGCVTAADLAARQRTALMVNTGRAESIGPEALAAALQAGRPRAGRSGGLRARAPRR